jgi:very-short-patch-repair endonuclease
MTDAERALWNELRGRRFADHKFKSQWTVGPFVADFCCWERRLVVEVDGGQHTEEADAARTAALNAMGYRVVRFWNNDVLTNMDGVLQTILSALESHPHPDPLPQAGEGEEKPSPDAASAAQKPSPARGRGLGEGESGGGQP